MEQIRKQIKNKLKEDLPKMDLRKVKLESMGLNNITFSYEGKKYKYNFYTQWLSYINLITRDNLRKEFI